MTDIAHTQNSEAGTQRTKRRSHTQTHRSEKQEGEKARGKGKNENLVEM